LKPEIVHVSKTNGIPVCRVYTVDTQNDDKLADMALAINKNCTKAWLWISNTGYSLYVPFEDANEH